MTWEARLVRLGPRFAFDRLRQGRAFLPEFPTGRYPMFGVAPADERRGRRDTIVAAEAKLPDHHLVIVPHTHWDREWYRTHEEFRYRLVRLLDGLLDLLEGDPDYRTFTLDGQVVVLDDYLEVRPGARERIEKLVGSGRLCIGPWYVLPDEWLVSGEALIRNLRMGLRRASQFGEPMRLGYVPDQFGHVGQLPQIFAGFGFDAAVLWRGVGEDVTESAFHWEAPDGTRLFTVYLRSGYGNGLHLPLEPEALAARLRAQVRSMAAESRIPVHLLMNGSDHAEPQAGLPAALEAAAAMLPEVTVEIGTLPDFAVRARALAPADLSVHRGELRSGLRSPLLPGCASARIPQKRQDFRNDRLLTRYVEPLAAWLSELGGDGDPEVIDLAWRIALENHPHDSICGCSIDAVHEQMETRFSRVAEIAGSHLRRVGRELANRVAVPRAGRSGREAFVAWNPCAGGIAQVDGLLEADVGDGSARPLRLHARGAGGRRIPVHATVESPGRILASYDLAASGAIHLARGFPAEFMGSFVNSIRCDEGDEPPTVDLVLSEDPPTDLDLAAAKADLIARLHALGERPVRFRARQLPRFRVRFVDDLPGCGVRGYRLWKGAAGARAAFPALGAERTPDSGARMSSADWRIHVSSHGRVSFEHVGSGVRVEDALRVVCEGDRGDEYNFDPVPGDAPVERPETVRVRVLPGSEASAAVRIDARYRVPESLTPERGARSSRLIVLRVQIELRLWRGLDRIDVRARVDNTARDHRLRLHLRAPFTAEHFRVESAFEVALRPIDPQPADFGSDRPAELPIGATPQRTFAALDDGTRAFTVANRGSPEVEAVPEPDGATSLAVTLVRAVGWLSHDDLVLRPGHAGPGLETPGAQCPGEQVAELSVRLHDAGDPGAVAEAHRFASPALLCGGGSAGPLPDGARLVEVDDPAVVVSAIEPRSDGAARVRLYNATARARRIRLAWNGSGSGLARVDLAGRTVASAGAEPESGALTLELRPAEIATFEAR